MPPLFTQTHLLGLAGGVLIGTSAAVLLLGNGRILGASGILGRLVTRESRGADARDLAAFVAALALVPAIAALIGGAPAFHSQASLPVLVLAGLAVGLGTRMANGCTSGHGVVGMTRFSRRSILATVIALGTGFVTYHIAHSTLGAL
ncbi:YeeE/YedE family protein [Rhodobacter lacus]|uniref:YeeE/YedE family protein n=1 Tax=Rhodobacter lacus TaxID=1641972 RepID=A0ABW5A9B7_9RHOB